MDSGQFKGRKGQKRLKELNEKIERTLAQGDEYATKSQEMQLMLRSLPDPMTRHYFAEAYRRLDAYWGGIKTCGFLRLAAEWMRRKKLTELNRQKLDEMFMDILPAEEMQLVRRASQE